MGWERQVRTLYTISILMLVYILWAALIFALFRIQAVNSRIYLVWLSAVFEMQFIKSKLDNKVAIVGLPAAVGTLLYYACFPKVNIILAINALFLVFLLYVLFLLDQVEMNYEKYKKQMKPVLIFLIVLGIFIPGIEKQLAAEIFRYFILSFISAVIVLREIRLYDFGIRNKKSIAGNIIIGVIIIFLSTDFGATLVVMLLGLILKGIEGFYLGLAYLVSPFLSLLDHVKVKDPKGMAMGLNGLAGKTKGLKPKVPIGNRISDAMSGIGPFIKAAIVIIILFLIYRQIRKLISKGSKQIVGITLEREKIARDGKQPFDPLKVLRKLFKRNDIRENILYTYFKFEYRTSAKGIFKNYMTANELKEETKPLVTQKEDVISLTNIYNETKFSDHNITEDKLIIIRNNYNNLKKDV